ncbi:chemotaxis response regulator protein-glutamate methylesterase [Rickettsiales bacterium]|nr:chemotaxis response regulator protein-glutamate methylesterase [Rickettsiales bacterium]
MAKISVLIIDDSALIRNLFTELLSSDPDINVIGTAIDPYDAREKIKQLNPDVITLDIEMPKMDGIAFLEKVMKLRPMPVVMVSTLTQKGAQETIKALELGAVEYVSKPTSSQTRQTISVLKDELISKVKTAAKSNIRGNSNSSATKKNNNLIAIPKHKLTKEIIAIGSSTGGVEALKEVLTNLPAGLPPIVIVQHMPVNFTKSFADRLNTICKMSTYEAHDKQILEHGCVYIAKGDKHLKIKKSGSNYQCVAAGEEKVSGHCPSVDVLFESVAEIFSDRSLGVILTGMGKDGARGMLKMRKAGAYNIGQDQQSCVVYGMPKEAFENGAVNEQVSLQNIASKIIKYCTE